MQALVRQEADGVARVDGEEDLGTPDDGRQAEDSDGCEPKHHDRPKNPTDAGRPARLRSEQGKQNH